MLRPLAMEERRDKVGLRKEGEAPGPEREMRCGQRHITSGTRPHSTQHPGEQRNGTAMKEAKANTPCFWKGVDACGSWQQHRWLPKPLHR